MRCPPSAHYVRATTIRRYAGKPAPTCPSGLPPQYTLDVFAKSPGLCYDRQWLKLLRAGKHTTREALLLTALSFPPAAAASLPERGFRL
jgi:hypothetical protein